MYEADPGIPPRHCGITRAEPDGLLNKRNRLLVRAAGHELAHAHVDKGVGIVAICREHDFEFGYCLLAPPREAQQFAFDAVRVWVPRGGRSLDREEEKSG